MARAQIRGHLCAVAVVLMLGAMASCSVERRGGGGDEPRVPPAGISVKVVGAPESECELPVLVDVPEKWVVEPVTPEMVERADDPRLTDPGGFAWVCSFLGSPAGTPGMISIFVAPPRLAGGLTAERLLQRFVRAAHDEVRMAVREVTVDAGPGFEGEFATSSGYESSLRQLAFVLPTPNGAVAVAHIFVQREEVDPAVLVYESVRDSMRLPD